MITLKTVVRTPRKDGIYPVYIRCVKDRKIGYIKTDKLISTKDLDSKGNITDPYVNEYCARRILDYTQRLNRKDISRWSIKQVVDYLSSEEEDICFSDYARQHIDRMIDNGQIRNAKNYKLALQHLERYAGTTKVMFGMLTSTWVNLWIKSLNQTARAKEMYPVCIRQIFREAVREYNDYDNELIRIKTNPWSRVKIPNADRAEKRAISAEDCRKFFTVPLPDSPSTKPKVELGRDVAKMVLCMAGINTIDLYNLKKSDYHNGVISYRRAKTKKSRTDDAYFEIRIEPIIMPLINKYASEDNDPYLLNFHCRYVDSDSFSANVNAGIKDVCKVLKIPEKDRYCVYTFRHTWGTIAQNDCGATISEVGFGLNHSHGHTITRGYLRIDFTPAWELNRKVIEFIFFSSAQSKQGTAKDLNLSNEIQFRLSPKKMVYARAYFRGEMLAEITDIGFANIEEVISSLVTKLPDTIPSGCAVHFRIKDIDGDREAVYERTKGKGF
ncbi:MAG: site-specific integrase [Muribaculaceae bacterium]|nr:site-specific integrase [Muribaculaceae bacterium]